MRIRELEIDNFKSFANKVTIPFLEGFTTISGPNGSGKSNIIDSVLFALGLASARKFRAERTSDVISKHNNRHEAYVKVKFAPEGPDEEEISVARLFKKGAKDYSSTYYLNDKPATLAEIHNILEKYNVTPNSYNVVMQNEVMNITGCSALERRRIIDEIAGIADFDRRLEQAHDELNVVEGRVEKSNIVLNEVNTRIEQLSQEREQAVKYQKLRDEKISLEGQITTVKYFDIKRSIERVHESILDFNKKKKEEEVKLKKLLSELKEAQEVYAQLQEEVKAKGEAEQLEVKKQAETLKGEIERKENAFNYAEKNIQDNLKTIENAKNGIESFVSKIKENELNIENKKIEIQKTEQDLDKEKKELARVIDEISGLNQTADKYLEKRNNLRKTLEETKDKETSIIQEKLPLENDLTSFRKNISDAKKSLEQLKEFKSNFEDNKQKIELQIEQLSKELEDFKIIQQNTLHDLDTLKNELSDKSYNIQLAYKKIANLEGQKAAFDEVGLGKAVETVMAAHIEGVHAPLLQLGTVEKEYSTALEVAMGGRMKNIVVEDDEVARIAIDILKSANAGRATFLPLNKLIKAPKSLNLPRGNGVIDFAINLIDFDDEYLNAFYWALGDTLVVESYQDARQFIGKYRTVTLSGELFEKSGSISGGALGRNTLKFSQGKSDELEEFKLKLKKLEEDYRADENKKKNLETKLDKTRIDYSNAVTELSKAKLELTNLVKNFEGNEQSVKENENVIQELTPKIEQIEKKLDKLEERHADCNQKITELSEEIEKIEALMSPQELTKLKEKTSSFEENIKMYEGQIVKANADIDNFKREINFQNTLITSKEEQIEKLGKDNETLKGDKIRYKDEAQKIKAEVEVLEKKIEELGKNLIELQTKRDAAQQKIVEFETQKNVMNNDIERIAEQIESFKARRRELDPQLEEVEKELKAKNVDVSVLEPTEISIDEITRKINNLQRRMDDLGAVNMRAIMDYDRVVNRQNELKTQIETLAKERQQILAKMQGYEDVKKETFMKAFDAINENFSKIFTQLAEGEGTLVLQNPESPFDAGLTIEAQPRDKKKQKLELMSGGEKSLTALAFVFAIQKYMPAPFYAMDEVDANLDGINVEKLAQTIKEQAKHTQFIVVSHRKPMIESANRTIGVTQKEKGKTRVTGVKWRED